MVASFFFCLPKTSNIQHSTPNTEVASMFSVECSMLNVSGHSFRLRIFNQSAASETMKVEPRPGSLWTSMNP
jgi:hypothetical protein